MYSLLITKSFVDYTFKPKASYYAIKREIAPIGLGLERYDNKRAEVWVVNGKTKAVASTLSLTAFRISTGQKLYEHESVVQAPANQSTTLSSWDFDATVPHDDIVVSARLVDDKKSVIARASNWPQPLRFLPYPAVNPMVSVKLEKAGGYIQKIVVTSQKPVKGVHVVPEALADEESAVFDDNMVDVVPGDAYVISVKGLKEGATLLVRFMGDREIAGNVWPIKIK
jgi:beta-mannosidase